MFGFKKKGTIPDSMSGVMYHPDNTRQTMQDHWSWPWPTAPAHEQRSALVNCWTGNQLPGEVNFIPGVVLSKALWNVPTSYANTLRNKQYNIGMNTGGMSSVGSSDLQMQIQQAWQNRSGF